MKFKILDLLRAGLTGLIGRSDAPGMALLSQSDYDYESGDGSALNYVVIPKPAATEAQPRDIIFDRQISDEVYDPTLNKDI